MIGNGRVEGILKVKNHKMVKSVKLDDNNPISYIKNKRDWLF